MNRRHFLQSSLLAGMLTRVASAESSSASRTSAGFKVAAKSNRFGEDLLIMGGRFDLKVSAHDTGGDLCIYDTVRDGKGGPALHRHHFQDEWFYIIRGRFVVQVGDQMFEVAPGDSACATQDPACVRDGERWRRTNASAVPASREHGRFLSRDGIEFRKANTETGRQRGNA